MPRQAILFLIDTQGANCVGCYANNPRLGTPNIDRLAGQGQRFDRAYCASPVCGPARSAIFTGLYPHSNGVLGNDMAPHIDVPTLGQRLGAADIATGYIGKWHLDGSDYFGDGRCPPGWDPRYWFDGRNYLESLPDDDARALSRRILKPADVAETGITAEFTHAHRTADRALDFIAEHRDRDFFLVVSIDEPHHPHICPEPFVSSFDDFALPIGPAAHDDLVDKPLSQREWRDYQLGRRAEHVVERDGGACFRNPSYFSCNSYSDFEVGRVIAAIDELVPQALVVYTADHGDMFFAHGLLGKGPVMYDEITRVPLIVRHPALGPAGTTDEAPVSHVDLVPTFLEYFGLERPALLQGRSLWSELTGPTTDAAAARRVFLEFNRFEVDHDGFGSFTPIRCVTDGRYKLALHLMEEDEFYDLANDPAELRNGIHDATTAEVRDQLHDAILHWMADTRDPLRCPQWGRRAWRNLGGSTWGGATRPRPFDPTFFPQTLLYDTGRIIDRRVYLKS